MLKRICSLRQKIITHKFNKTNASGFVFMFHKISKEKTDDEFSISEKNFCYFVECIQQHIGFAPLKNIESNTNLAFLTFDDGHSSVKSIVPFLERNRIYFTLFITLNYLDTSGYMSTNDLTFFSTNPYCDIGSHTMSHPMLRFSKEQLNEISNSKALLENIISRKVSLFAYPYGSIYACGRSCITKVRQSEYDYAFSTIQSGISKDIIKDRFFIPRINVNDKNFINIINCLERRRKNENSPSLFVWTIYR